MILDSRLEVIARYAVELEGKAVVRNALKAVGEFVDGVIRPGQGAVAAGIGGGELVVGVELLAGVDGKDGGLALVELHAAAVGVEHIFGIDEVAMVLDQPVDAIRFAAFLIGGEREDDVAIGLKAFAVQAEEGLDQDGVGLLHVLGAAAVVVAVFGYELEGVGGPVAAACFDDIEMADEQDGLFAAGAVIADDQILLAVVGAEQLHVRGGKAGVEESLLHGFGCCGDAADRVGGVDLDELAKDVDCLFVVGVSGLGADERGTGRSRKAGQKTEWKAKHRRRKARRVIRIPRVPDRRRTRLAGSASLVTSIHITAGTCHPSRL